MPQINVNSSNIATFGFSATFDLVNRQVTFDISTLTVFNGAGASNVKGVAFSLVDQDGVVLASIDWTAPQIPGPITQNTWILDLSAFNLNFLLNTYAIVGAIQDQNSTVYTTPVVYKTICKPPGLLSNGYVPGQFQLIVDCNANSLTVKELTVLVYNSLTPVSITKTGTLYYPTGTIPALNFSNTPFTNNVVYTGQMRIKCNTSAKYDLGDNVFVTVSYVTDSVFDVTCTDRISNVICCIMTVQKTYLDNCDNAIGKAARQKLDSILMTFLVGLAKEINGQDASVEADAIRKALACNCGSSAVGQNEVNPINPSVYSIVISGQGGTSVPTTTIIGNTQFFTVVSNIYEVVKANNLDLAFSITLDNSTPNTVKYKIAFNYNVFSQSILTAIAADPTLIAQLQALVNATGLDLSGLDGKCVINLSMVDYLLSQLADASTLVTQVVIDGNIYVAPANTHANNALAVQNWLNTLSKGVFTVGYAAGTITISSLANTHTLSTMSFSSPNVTLAFTANRKDVKQILQAIFNWLCSLTALQVALSNQLSLCLFDYSGNAISINYPAGSPQDSFNLGVSQAICNIVARIQALSGVTCDTLKAIFVDRPTQSFASGDRFFGTLGGNCSGITNSQAAMSIINAINSDPTVKTAFCAINCSVPATCPDVIGNNLNIVGTDIGVYGVIWVTVPNAGQTVTVRYRAHNSIPWLTSTNNLQILPNGNVTINSPYHITGLSAGVTYDVWITNNCGGSGFISQITTPTGAVYSGSFLLDSSIYTICGQSAVTLYSNLPLSAGTNLVGRTLYVNVGLTIPVTGYTLVANVADGVIYTINSSTGVVTGNSGLTCSGGTLGNYILGNNSGTICSGMVQGLYTNGAFVIGGILYLDSSLSTPVTGFSFVVNGSNNHIYNLNSATGQIGSDTGLSCSTNTVKITNTLGGTHLTAVTGITGFTPSPPLPVDPGGLSQGTHSAFTGGINITVTGSPVVGGNLTLKRNGIVLQCIAVAAAGTFGFSSQTYVPSDVIEVQLNSGGCS